MAEEKTEDKRTEIETIFSSVVEGVFIAATLDVRGKNFDIPIAIRVTYQRKRLYHRTGMKITYEDYPKLLKAKGVKGMYSSMKNNIESIFIKVEDAVRELTEQNNFSFEALKTILGKQPVNNKTLFDYWVDFEESRNAQKTKDQYRQSMNNFYRSLGCKLINTYSDDGKKERKMKLSGTKLSLTPKDITPEIVAEWEKFMDNEGLSASTKSIYMRAFRAVMNHLKEEKVIAGVPKMKIKSGDRRNDDYLTVPDILKIKDYTGGDKWSADWWLILYMCNGCNLRDLASLTWNDNYEFDNELSFVRAKTAHKAPVQVYIPVISELQDMLDLYASKPNKGELVFPQILLDAKTEKQISNRVHDFNATIRRGMINVCSELSIRTASASTARNSYITCLTWHGTSDAFIDTMVGHTDSNNVLRGYQGKISPKKRMSINNLLFTNPEEE